VTRDGTPMPRVVWPYVEKLEQWRGVGDLDGLKFT
jgi:hypothetical protein